MVWKEGGRRMSIEREARLAIGWRINQDDIPDFEERYEYWDELRPQADECSSLVGTHVMAEDLVDEEDAWCGDGDHIVGVPAPTKPLPSDEFVRVLDRLAAVAGDVYRTVMRKEPEDGPYVISYERVW